MASSESLLTDRSEDAPVPAAEAEAKPRGGLRHKVIRAAYWTVAERILSQVIRLGGNIILSHLLFKEAFGIAATISVFQEMLIMFTDVGTGDVVIQHKDGGSQEFLNTVWTIQVLRGLGLTAVAIAISWPAAQYWLLKPDLASMLTVSSLYLAINGFTSIKMSVAVRQMNLGILAIRNLLSQIIGLIALIGLAFWMRSAWALVYGQILASFCNVLLSYAMPGPSNHFGWDRPTLKYVSQYGRWIFISTMLTFVSGRGDSFLMARYLSSGMFGLYNIGSNLASIPTMGILMLGERIVFPLLSQIARDDRSRLPATYNQVCTMLYLTSLPAIGLLAGIAPTLVHILYPKSFEDAGWITQILTIRAALDCLFAPGKAAMIALGLPRYQGIAQATRAVLLFASLPVAYHYYGIAGAAYAAACNGILAVLVIQWSLYDNGLFNLKRELKGIGLLIVGSVFGFWINHLILPFFS